MITSGLGGGAQWTCTVGIQHAAAVSMASQPGRGGGCVCRAIGSSSKSATALGSLMISTHTTPTAVCPKPRQYSRA